MEILKTNQSLIKLGTQKIKKYKFLIVEINDFGILVDKKLLNLNDMNDINFLKQTTEKDFKKDSFVYNVFSSMREKINAPAKNRGK